MFDIEHVAKLARLGLSEKEKDRFQKDLSSILDFIEKMKEVDVDDTPPTAQATGLLNVSRQDEIDSTNPEERRGLLANAPETRDGYIKVKAVFE